ncbi:hypothetical protein IDM48_04475 [Rothia amarae]|uniref:Uncharacterized protein n=1 Tax=Rothia amarae TaxID=169480 RepID=A0A7H2BLW7_9MICC|nr:hypothetical protein [Rothia amarae]QNV40663.1 hypothetical protein IDM48_04475 [Rothia amarae]
MIPFSSVESFRAHAPEIAADDSLVEQRIFEASVMVHASYPDLQGRIDAGNYSADIAELVVNRMVRRSLESSDVPSGIDSLQSTAGPFAQTVSFASSRDGNVFLSSQDKALLRGPRRSGRAFTVFPAGGAV